MKMYTTKEVAEILRVTSETVRRYIRQKKIKVVKLSKKKYLIPESALRDFLSSYKESN